MTTACTIVSNSHLAYARVLADSYRQHHPGAPIFVCIADEPHPLVRYAELPFTTIFARDLEIPAFRSFAFRYGILELISAVKPFFLTHLRDSYNVPEVFYLDSDIWICDRLADLEKRLKSHPILLTPHITEPLDNEHHPSEQFIRQVGVYNLGFLGMRLGPETAGFLEWWKRRLHRFCFSEVGSGLFVDQSWMDFAPAFVDGTAVVRDPVYNVAYWNLPHRHPRKKEGYWRVSGRRVGFFHFSGFSPEHPDEISCHQNRLTLSERPELRDLFSTYCDLIHSAGHSNYAGIPSGYSVFAKINWPIPSVARRTFARVDPNGLRWKDPFEIAEPDSFLRWLLEPLDFERGTLSRATLALWEQRPDLIRSFPRVCDEDLPRYVDWALGGGGAQAGLHPAFLGPLRKAEGKRRRWAARSRTIHPYDASLAASAHVLLETIDLRHPAGLAVWLNQPVSPAGARPTLTLLALMIHGSRADLRRAFPDPLGKDRAAFATWFCRHAARPHRLSSRLVAPVQRSLSPMTRVLNALRLLIYVPLRDQLDRWRSREVVSDRWNSIGPAEARWEAGRAEVRSEFFPLGAAEGNPGVESGRGEAAREVNLVGHFGMPTGVSQMAHGSRAVLQRLGLHSISVDLDTDPRANSVAGRTHHPDGFPFRVTLMHANADETPEVLSRLPLSATAGTSIIGYWFWELAHFPRCFSDRFGHLSEVWAPSHFCARAFQTIAPIPVRYVPPHVPRPVVIEADRSEFGLELDRFYFFFCFDVGSGFMRKNPLATIEALKRLVEQTDRRVGLFLKITRAHLDPEAVRRISEKARGLPVTITTRVVSRRTIEEMIASSDAILSLHRSEGLGLLPIEGLYLDKPVVATQYGGVTDYLDSSTGYPVDYRLHTLDQAYGPYPPEAVWAEPDTEHAVEQMRRVVELPDEARERTRIGRQRIEELYGLESAVKRFDSEFRRVFRHLEEIRRKSPRGPGRRHRRQGTARTRATSRSGPSSNPLQQ